MPPRAIDTDERRRRLGRRHGLAKPVSNAVESARAMVGLHASDPATVYLSARARVRELDVGELERTLYEARALLRVLGMRRTMFVLPRDLAGLVDAACTKALVAGERRRMIGLVESQGLATDGAAWVDDVAGRVLRALDELGSATAVELSELLPALGLKLSFGEGRKWAGTVGVSTRILFLLATHGVIVRGRPRGSWLSSQYEWSSMRAWIGEPLPERDPREARADLARLWLGAFGPGTVADLKWWTGWTLAAARQALSDASAVEVALGPDVGYVAAGDEEPEPDVVPWVALVPALDPTPMGWKGREWFVGELAGHLFDRNGNIGPTVWANGRIVGGWAQRPDGSVVTRLEEDVGSAAALAIDEEAARLEEWFAGVVATPRFRTPLEWDGLIVCLPSLTEDQT